MPLQIKYIRAMKNLLFIALIIYLSACQTPQSENKGILVGETRWITGNQMPGPDKPASSGEAVQRVVHIYPATKYADCTTGPQGLFTEVPGTPVNTVMTNENGQFLTYLPEGTYSVFTREENGLFAGTMNGEGVINPVSIIKKDTTRIRVEINYTAAY